MPELLSLMAMEVPSKNPFSHSVLTFSDADMARTTESHRLEILHSFVDQLAAGLGDRKRMPYLCVDHGNHWHILCLRYDLRTGKVYQPFIAARGCTARLNAWKDLMCAVHDLELPSKSETLFRLSVKHAPEKAKALVKQLNNAGQGLVQKRGQMEAQALLKELEPVIQDEGFQVARMIKSGFSVTAPTMKRNIRIKYTEKALGKPERVVDEGIDELKERLACHREKLMQHMGRYHDGGMPEVRGEVVDGEMPEQSPFNRHLWDKKMANGIHHFHATV